MEIKGVEARQILDSRGLPTVEVCLDCGDLGTFTASVPSGASTGSREACELRDNDKEKFHGKGVTKAVKNVETLGELLKNESKISVTDQKALDEMLEKQDKSDNLKEMGANAILALSMAICRAGAAKNKKPLYKHINGLVKDITGKEVNMSLPAPFFNVLNGGKHADNSLACQEIMFTAEGSSLEECIRFGSETFHTLKAQMKKQSLPTNVGDEGGFAADITPQKGIDMILEAAGNNRKIIGIGFDFAASEFCQDGKYNLDFKKPKTEQKNILTSDELEKYYLELISKNPSIVSIEDPFSEDGHEAFASLVKKVDAKKCQIVADDLTVTNQKEIKRSVQNKEATALLVKMNQIGSVSSTIKACHEATSNDWSLMVSHRSGETTDDFAADLSVGLGSRAVKFGAPSRGERVVKYNRLMAIEKMEKGNLKMHPQKFLS